MLVFQLNAGSVKLVSKTVPRLWGRVSTIDKNTIYRKLIYFS